MSGADVFISYRHKDQTAVFALVEVLKQAGLSVWIDNESVEDFDRIHDRVAQGIATSKVFLAWYSALYASSRPCQWELAAAWLTADGERVLTINPESDSEHIRPTALLQRLYSDARDLQALAGQVKVQATRFEQPMGEGVTLNQPLHYGRELTGLNTFVGRMPQLWDIHGALTKSGAAMLTGEMRSVAQLRGFGGMGKSALAEEYALRFGAAYQGGIFWLNAYGNDDRHKSAAVRDAERLRQITEFAGRLNLPVAGKQAGEIQGMLGRLMAAAPRRSLWIVDDLPSGLTHEEALMWLSPHSSVPTLITTRDRSLAKLGTAIDIDVLSDSESIDLLRQHITIIESELPKAKELAEQLGHHALALEVAGSYLKARDGEPIEEFLNDLRSPDDDVLEQAAEFADALPLGHSPSIVATLRNTIDQLSQPARDLLCLASCIATAPIPPGLVASVLGSLMNLPAKKADFERLKAAKETDRFGLSRPDKSRREALTVHALVARTARRHPDSSARIDAVEKAAAVALIQSLSSMYTVGAILRLNLEVTHARAVATALETSAAGELLVLVANTDLIRGDLEIAEKGTLKAVEFCTREFGPQSLEAYEAQAGVAAVALAKRDIDKAVEIYREIRQLLEAKLAPGNRYRVGLLAGLAMISLMRGDSLEAKCRIEALVAENDAVSNDEAKLGGKRFLFQMMVAIGDRTSADRLAKEITEAEARIADLAGIDALSDQFLLMQMTLAASGDMLSAAPVIERAAEVFANTLGENSLLTLQAQSYRLMLMSTRGDPQTREFAAHLTERLERIYGPNNPATLEARGTEAQALMWLGDFRKAVEILAAVTPIYERVLGTRQLSVLTMKVSLAQALNASEDYAQSLDVIAQVVAAAEAKDKFLLMNALSCRANCQFKMNARAEESKTWQQVLELQKAQFGERSRPVLTTQVSLAWALWATGEGQRAIELLQITVPVAAVVLGEENHTTKNARVALQSMASHLATKLHSPSA